MKAVEFVGQSRVLAPPKDWDNEAQDTKCGGLPVQIDILEGDIPRMASVWKPSEDELLALVNGAHVVLSVLSVSHPPVSLEVIQGIEELP